jgi:PPK2 family polyphosphate:nucleotide phosphotransferase
MSDFARFIIPFSESAIQLSDYDPSSKAGFDDKKDALRTLEGDIERMEEQQDMFAAQTERAILIVLQGMDTAGKDGIIKHVMTGINPEGVHVHSFREPSTTELRHDYLWRESNALPERGRIAIFNRSYYEEVLVVRVQPQLLSREGVTAVSDVLWQNRFEDINAFEHHLTRSGTIVLKFFLHISKDEQRKRLLARLETPTKMWKASDADLAGHAQWDAYANAYEEMLGRTSTPWAPWYAIPSDHKWVARVLVASIILDTFERLQLAYPEPSPARREAYEKLADQLEAEG